jgi:serine/threonine protein kinase
MSELKNGQVIQTADFKSLRVLDRLGEGGQGIVYKVEYDGQPKALKWYFKSKLKKPQKFYDNIKNNITHGKPTNAFLWPEVLTEWVDGTFGYVMPLRPPQYGDFSKYLLAKANFKNVDALVNAALNIVEGFMELHRKGFNYQDLNDGNFFVNFENGDVLICDNDNVMGQGFYSGIAGKCRYMAPEIVRGEKMPGKETDRFSLAVVLFLLLFVNHPLEGKATNPPCMTEEHEQKFFGSNPVFIFDPNDKSNLPILGLHENVIKKWPIFPEYIKEAFIEAFSYERLHAKKPRLMEKDWLTIFTRLRGEIIKCGCGRENFVDPTSGANCKCGRHIHIPAHLKFKKVSVPLYPTVKLFACHTVEDSEDFKTPTAEVIVKKDDPTAMGIRNLSDVTWYVSGADGNSVPKKKGEVVRIASGLTIDFGHTHAAEIIAN